MTQIEPLNLREPVKDAPYEPTRFEVWFDRLGLVFGGAVYCLSIPFRWARLPFLLFFPTAVPFAYFIRVARRSKGYSKRKLIAELMAMHASVLVGIVLLWKKIPVVQEPFWPGALGAVVVIGESIVGSIFLYLERRQRETTNGVTDRC